ncbi:Uncharacterised protein [Mycobacterium tuberculosis]|nr:Uncharacterised protein [Mycobacterium tuberculosis]
MCRRSASIGTWAVPSYPSVCRLTTRNRNGAGRGAEARRCPAWWASVPRTTMSA